MNVNAANLEGSMDPTSADQSFSETGEITALLQTSMSGDAAAFTKLVCSHLDQIYTYIFYQVKDQGTAEELVFEVFLDAYKKIQSYNEASDLSLWLLQITHDYLANDPRFTSTIPFAEKQVILLKFMLGLNNQDIAWITRQKTDSVKHRQAQALLNLKKNEKSIAPKLTKELCEALDNCFQRISSGESKERCLFQNSKMRAQLDPLLSVGLFISGSQKVKPGKEFRASLSPKLEDRLQTRSMQIYHLKTAKNIYNLKDKMDAAVHNGFTSVFNKKSTASAAPEIHLEAEQTNEIDEIEPEITNPVQKVWRTFRTSKILTIALAVTLVVVIAAAVILSGGLKILTSMGGSSPDCVLDVISGTVSVQMPGKTDWQPMTAETKLSAGAKVKTAASSMASLTYTDGSQVTLSSNTEMEIVKANFDKNGVAVTEIKQTAGKLTSKVTKLTSPEAGFVINTTAAAITVKGTQFITEIKPDKSTFVSVTQGTVNVNAQNKDVLVNAGYQLTVAPGKAPGTPTANPTTPADTPTPTTAPVVKYTLALKNTAGGKIISPEIASTEYPANTEIKLLAVADPGYAFTGWTGDNAGLMDSLAASTKMIIKSNTTLTASFTKTYTVTIRTLGGSIKSPGESSHDYPTGEVVKLDVTPDSGYEFVNWTGDVATILDPKSAQTTITVKSNCNITANFIRVYKLTVSPSKGGFIIKPGEGSFIYRDGAQVDVLAVPDTGYVFSGWTCDGDDIANPASASTKITINKDATLSAKFTMPVILSTLNITSGAGGKVTQPDGSYFTCKKGAVVNLLAVPNPGYGFQKWTGDISTIASVTSASTTITMTGNYSITANFVPAFDLTVNTSAGGTVLQPGGVTYTYNTGTIVPLKAIPMEGYRFVNWTGDITTVADPKSATTTITIVKNATITANFVKDYTLTVSTTSGGTVMQPGNGKFQFAEGSIVKLVAVADYGFTFANWTIDGVEVADPTSPTIMITIKGNVTITANFTPVNGG